MIKINKKGFTLLELLIAMGIMSIIALAFFGFLNSSIKFNTKNEKDIKALNIAQSEVENIREQIKSGKKDSFITCDNEDIKLGYLNEYEVLLDEKNNAYNINIELTKEQNDLYNIKVNVKFSNEYFSKKSVNLITQVFGG